MRLMDGHFETQGENEGGLWAGFMRLREGNYETHEGEMIEAMPRGA